jgi:hypothetical protein
MPLRTMRTAAGLIAAHRGTPARTARFLHPTSEDTSA